MNNKRILITGITSIHGWPVYRQLQLRMPAEQLFGIRPPKMRIPANKNVISLCITNRNKLQQLRENFRPTHVIHCAGVCDLDVCEERPQWAHALNVNGAAIIADTFGDDAYVLFMSTDLVFSGINPPKGGYAEHHPPDPISVAGKTFAEAEQHIRRCPHHCIIRLGLPLGDSVTGEKGAIDWIESRFKRNLPVTLFYDEFRSCVWCNDIAIMAERVLERTLTGMYHYGGERSWSLHDIGLHVIRKGGYPPELLTGIMRHEEVNGPPRIGDVSLNSAKLQTFLSKHS